MCGVKRAQEKKPKLKNKHPKSPNIKRTVTHNVAM